VELAALRPRAILREEMADVFFFFRHIAERLDEIIPRLTNRPKTKAPDGDPKEEA